MLLVRDRFIIIETFYTKIMHVTYTNSGWFIVENFYGTRVSSDITIVSLCSR